MLSKEERKLLKGFVARNGEQSPYWRRVNIILLSDAGMTPESIAVELGSSIVQTRKWLNVYKRKGLAVFPNSVLHKPALFSPNEHIAEAGRAFFREQLAIIERYDEALRERGATKAVHETRKAIRRSRNAYDLLTPYYEPGTFRRFQRRLRQTMRRLGPARDRYIFLHKLDQCREQCAESPGILNGLERLSDYWQLRLEQATQRAQEAVRKAKYQKTLAALADFCATPGQGVAHDSAKVAPTKVRHLAPSMVMLRVAHVLAYDEIVPEASLEQLHELRIHFKRLRYTLDFFAPILGNERLALTRGLNRIQDHLGDLNDANVARSLLDETPGDDVREFGRDWGVGVRAYRLALEAEIERLQSSFGDVWRGFDSPAWRRTVLNSMSQL